MVDFLTLQTCAVIKSLGRQKASFGAFIFPQKHSSVPTVVIQGKAIRSDEECDNGLPLSTYICYLEV